MKPREAPTYDFDVLSLEDARYDYPKVWETAKQALMGLTDEQITIVVSLVVDTCPDCHEMSRDCACWNDE